MLQLQAWIIPNRFPLSNAILTAVDLEKTQGARRFKGHKSQICELGVTYLDFVKFVTLLQA